MKKSQIESVQRKFKNNKQMRNILKAFSSDKKKEKTEKDATFLFCSQNEREICDIVQRLLLGDIGE